MCMTYPFILDRSFSIHPAVTYEVDYLLYCRALRWIIALVKNHTKKCVAIGANTRISFYAVSLQAVWCIKVSNNIL